MSDDDSEDIEDNRKDITMNSYLNLSKNNVNFENAFQFDQ